MPCLFCGSEEKLTDEHIFPAFMGGQIELRNGSCQACNGDFAIAEGVLKNETVPILNLLKIENRYGVVPNAPLIAEIRGMDMKNLPAFMDGEGEINLSSVVRTSITPEGKKLREGFFLTKQEGDKFTKRGRAQGAIVTERDVPREIVIEAMYTQPLYFAFSLETRRVVAKIALTALVFEYGMAFARDPQFDGPRLARAAVTAENLGVLSFANEGIISASLRNPHQHSVIVYLSAGMHKGWALVTLFGGLTYIVELTSSYNEPASRQFSIYYDAKTKTRVHPIVLADEMTLIGHVLSPATQFEARHALDAQWFPIVSGFCSGNGIVIERECGKKPEGPTS
jgi:hypothetical protein